MTYFCPACWDTVDPHAVRCPRCSSDIRSLDQRAFSAKLVAALRHPEPATRQRAAFILGELRQTDAIPVLGQILTETAEPFFAAEIARVLGKMGNREADAFLRVALHHEAFLVREAAVEALASKGRMRRP
jgi:HEAT repeat protein